VFLHGRRRGLLTGYGRSMLGAIARAWARVGPRAQPVTSGVVRSALVVASLASTSGCAEGLPLEERIASTRPLAIRVEVLDPAAPADTPVRAEGLPLQRARIVPFIVDPGGPLTADEIAEAIDPVWLACVLPPTQGLFGCLSAALPLELDGLVDCPGVDPAALDLTEIPRAPSPCRITQGSAAAPELGIFLDASFLLGGDIEATMIGHHPGEGSTAQCAAALLSGANPLPDACLYAVARVPVGPKGELLRLAAELGVPTDGLPPIPEPIPEPDTHPRIRSFTVRVFDQDAQVDRIEIEPGDTLRAPAGARLEIETEASEDDLQTYVIPVDSTEYAERDETFRGRWFRTWGTLLSPSSNDPRSRNVWTMVRGPQDEDDLPPGNMATLYYVLRDTRSGVDWTWFHVELE
jgi:hypothetical protein